MWKTLRLALCASLLLLLPIAVLSQSFKDLAPLPTPANMSGVWFTSPTDGWAVGDRHTLLRTRDHGVTWSPVALPGYPTEPLYDITFVSAQVGFITGNSSDLWQDIFRTTDGGATWKQVTNFPVGGSWRYLRFVSATTGFAGGDGALVRTTDGGATWPIRSAYPECPIIYGMHFLDANTGVVCGYQASSGQTGIFKTTNGGSTWTLKHVGYVNDAVYLSPTTLVACDSGTIIRSLNGGDTWTPISEVSTGFSSLTKVDASTIVGVSTGGDIWRSANGGSTWTLQMKGIGDLPAMWNLSFQDNLNGHVVGQGGAIYETTDGGVHWTALHRGIGREWNGIVAFSDSDVLLAGGHGYVQSTTDAGEHWGTQLLDPPTFGRDTAFSDVSIADPQTAIVVGHWGSLFKTADRGATWTNLSDRVNPSFYANGVKFTDANSGWMVGWDYNTGPKSYVRRTQDGGLSWQTVDAVNFPAVDVDFIGLNGWILAGGRGLYRTTNGGGAWSTIALPLSEGIAPNTMQMAWPTADIGYICGFDTYLVKSTDGGKTWTKLGATNVGFVYLGVIARGTNEVWVCGATQGGGNAVVKRSLDGGLTWQSWSLPGQYTTPYKMVRTDNHLYVTGYDGAVWRMDLGSGTTPELSSISFTPNKVVGGSASTGTITLTAPAPAGGLTVALASNKAQVTVPASATVAAGAVTATFTANTSPVTANLNASVTAKANGVTRSATLSVLTLLKSVGVSPNNVVGGRTATGTVSLNGPAPAGGLTVKLSTTNLAASVPGSVLVAAGATSATFTVSTRVVSTKTTGNISAVALGVTRTSGVFTVKPPALTGFSFSPATIVSGAVSTAKLTINGAAPAGFTVTLSSANPAIAPVPASITFAAGATTATFSVTGGPVAAQTGVTVTVTDPAGVKRTATLTVKP